MGRRFDAFDTRLKIGESLFQSADTAVELRVRELDHRLRFREAVIHLLFDIRCLTIEFLINDGNGFGKHVESLLQSFRDDVEVPTRFGCRTRDQLFQLFVHRRHLTSAFTHVEASRLGTGNPATSGGIERSAYYLLPASEETAPRKL